MAPQGAARRRLVFGLNLQQRRDVPGSAHPPAHVSLSAGDNQAKLHDRIYQVERAPVAI
jgi:hypothetical protein